MVQLAHFRRATSTVLCPYSSCINCFAVYGISHISSNSTPYIQADGRKLRSFVQILRFHFTLIQFRLLSNDNAMDSLAHLTPHLGLQLAIFPRQLSLSKQKHNMQQSSIEAARESTDVVGSVLSSFFVVRGG